MPITAIATLPSHTLRPWPCPADEDLRAASVASLGDPKSLRSEGLQNIARLAAHICGTPFAAVMLVGADRTIPIATFGTPATDTDRRISMCARAICAPSRVVHASDVEHDPLLAHPNLTVMGALRPTTYAAAAMESITGHRYGTVCAFADTPTHLSEVQLDALDALADTARQLLESNSRATRFESISRSDALTGIANRRAFVEWAEHHIHQARRGEARPALALFDIDGLKAVNDSLGHVAGDLLISEFARRLSAVTRRSDLVARLGGDEFVVLMPNTTASRAAMAARRIQKSVAASIDLGDNTLRALRASCGVGAWMHAHDTVEALLHRADEAMYVDKRRAAIELAP